MMEIFGKRIAFVENHIYEIETISNKIGKINQNINKVKYDNINSIVYGLAILARVLCNSYHVICLI